MRHPLQSPMLRRLAASPARLYWRALSTAPLRVKGIVWDMDGTLTKDGAIDFEEMYRRSGAATAGQH